MFRLLRVTHKITGTIGAFLIIGMAITGLLLNHRSWIGYSSPLEIRIQQIIFEVHSGKTDGLTFVWATDLSAFCMIVLSITGLWLCVPSTFRKKFRRKK